MRHRKTYDPFSGVVSLLPLGFSYEDYKEEAIRSYPGAKNVEEALLFAYAHASMRLEKAIKHYSEYHHREDTAGSTTN